MFDSLLAAETTAILTPDISDAEATEALFLANAGFDEDYAAFERLDRIFGTLENLDHLSDVIGTHGVTTSLLAFANRNQLLSTAIPAFGACESLGSDALVGSAEALAAQEGLAAKAKDMAASWFKSAWDAIVSFTGKIGSFTKAAYAKVVATGKAIAGKTFDAAKAAKEKIKAHPIASAVAAVALVVAITSAIGLIWGLPLPTSAPAMLTWTKSVQAKLANPLDSHGFKVNGLDITYPKGFGVEELKTPAVLGYTAEKSTALVTSAEAALKDGSILSRLGATIAAAAKRLEDAVKSVGGDGAEFVRRAYRELLRITMILWRFISSKAVATITGALNLVRSLFAEKPASDGKALVPA